ncbi:S8 family serine peptidase [Planotetraspora sp. A-T 1434]|uniref:S8 family peptidase n=1 Tax=Planotetraspora sp. A-T 1434 TaxID=2979219 RepID=UPI0021C0841C|nr:S8 family serine peptidase [Planotetraspora sp. A-T 1434]MCT9933438.1 S8 family serine peptidase [Planotetraspora sp. A-T 1434]
MSAFPPRKAGLIALGAALMAMAGIPPAMAAPGAEPPSPLAAALANTADGVHKVTLITGDTVTVRHNGGRATGQDGAEDERQDGAGHSGSHGGGTVDVRRPDGSPSEAHIVESGDDLYVYPQSVLPYVAAGRLDKRLFDVTQLIRDGYDDAHLDRLPLIVSYSDGAAQARSQGVPEGAAKVRTLSSIQGAAVTEDRDHSAEFWTALTGGTHTANGTGARTSSTGPGTGVAAPAFAGGIAKVWLDGKVKATLSDTTAQIGAPEVWAGGNTGEGVDVAVLDTGVDAGHPDLAGRITASASFVPGEDVTDRQGHGTHVASTIAGTGAASDGKERGVAPGASLHIGKVLSNAGSGQDSWVLAGMEWAARDQHAKVISMSLGSGPTDGSDPLSKAVNALSAETGALFVIAAGNLGAPSTVSAPGAADAALTVGAVDTSDQLAPFSSQGPRLADEALKPELTAPGVDVLAARSQYAPEGVGYYQTMSGTSMATPHVAGAAALLAAAHPDWKGPQIKDALVSTTKPTPQYDAYQGGSGRLDVAAAVRGTVFATATAYTGIPEGAHPGTSEHVVTYTNTAEEPVVLDLAVDAPQAPDGLFALSENQVTVPARGTATVTLTMDPSRAATGAHYTGQIRASGSGGVVLAHTTIGVGTVREFHTLSLILKDGAGRPMSGTVEFIGEHSPLDFLYVDETGRLDLALPKDVYSAMAFVNVRGTHGPHSLGLALLGDPEIVLDHDTEVVLDASAAHQVKATTPRESATTFERMEYYRSLNWPWRSFLLSGDRYDSIWAQPTGEKVTHGDFYFTARWRKEQPLLAVVSKTTDYTDVLPQSGTTRLPEGHWDLRAVYAGNGSPSDYAGLDAKGKAVVVRRDPAVIGDREQAAAAAAAGAKLLLVQNDQIGREVRNYSPTPLDRSPIEVALLSTDEGEKLIAQARGGKNTLEVTSTPVSDYVYDLVEMRHGAIPADVVYRADRSNLARVDVAFRHPDPTRRGGEFRFDWPSYSEWGIGSLTDEPVRGSRTDWVSTGGGYRWGQEAYVEGMLYQIDARASYRPGSTTKEEWFAPIERPHLNDNYKLPRRTGDTLSIDIPGWGGADHVGMSMDYQGMRHTLSLYQGDTLLRQATFNTWVSADAPGPGRLPYRVVLAAERDPQVSPYSSKTRTEWDFQSETSPGEEGSVLPLLQLDYAVDTDADGRVRREGDLAVSVAHLPGAVGAGAVGPITLDVSYDDGATWHRASLTSTGAGAWRAGLHAPVTARYVSIRAAARDTKGNAVTQTVIRAAGLR